MRIFKYILAVEDKQIVSVKGLKRVLSVCCQRDDIVLYCMVDETANATIDIEVDIIGTGNPCDGREGKLFIGTVPMMGGSLMWHVFYSIKIYGI